MEGNKKRKKFSTLFRGGESRRRAIIAIGFFVVYLLLFFSLSQVVAGVLDKASGWAWAGNIGWVSFNSSDCDTDDDGFVDPLCGGGSGVNMHTMDQALSTTTASFWGEDGSDSSGRSVSGAGDVNGDGFDDILIGAPGDEDGGGVGAGQTYLIFGKPSGWAMDTGLSTAAASFWGEDAGDNSGYSVSGAGDVDGDGFDDILIGAWGDDDDGIDAGQTYLIFGGPSGWAMDTDLSTVVASDGYASFLGEDAGDNSGYSVSGAGDVDGDFFDDFLIGAPGDEEGGGIDAGQTYLIFGGPSGWVMDTDLSTVVASDGYASFWGEDLDQSGISVSNAGDVNGDFFDDILIGAPGNEDGGGLRTGQTYLVLSDEGGIPVIDYGVDVDLATGNFSGYAWSDNIGWIKFDPTTTPPGETGSFPSKVDMTSDGSDCGTGIQYDLCGWARACAAVLDKSTCEGAVDPDSGNWDGWIKMRDDIGVFPYGVVWDPTTQELEGWAWGGDVVGWVSFNCDNDHDETTPGIQTCIDMGGEDYKVILNLNEPPTASGLAVTPDDYCVGGSHSFSWIFSDPEGGSQNGYELEVTTDATFVAVPEVRIVLTSSATTRSVSLGVPPGVNQLAYNTTYYWRVKVFDPSGLDSGWVNYTDAAAAPPDSFTTEQHLYPDAIFSFSPAQPSQNEEISFTEAAVCYDITNSPTACPAAEPSYAWDFGCVAPATCSKATAIGQNATTTYFDTASHTVSFRITDNESFSCTGTDLVNLSFPLPLFREVAPSGG